MNARDGLLDFLVRYGGNCRDCADEDGFCPQTGIGCGQRRKAAEFFLGALEYGTKHGYAAGYRIIGPGELDRETLERAAEVAGTHIAEPGLSDNSAYIRFNPADLMAKKIVAAIRALQQEDRR